MKSALNTTSASATSVDSATSAEPLRVGLDWGNGKHDFAVRLPSGKTRRWKIDAVPEAVANLLDELRRLAPGQPLEICLEKSRGPLVLQLMQCDDVRLFLVDPKQAARYRESFSSGGAKDDLRDSAMLLRMLCERRDLLQPYVPDDELTRKIDQLVRTRRGLVDELKSHSQRLLATLKTYYPLALSLTEGRLSNLLRELVKEWPDPRDLQQASRAKVRRFLVKHRVKNDDQRAEMLRKIYQPLALCDVTVINPLSVLAKIDVQQMDLLEQAVKELEAEINQCLVEHPDAPLYEPIRGAGEALVPRIIGAFGSQRDRYRNAEEVGALSGILPATRQSGKSHLVCSRRGCAKFLKQTFHELADSTRKWCPWSKAYYQLQRAGGMDHHAALRKLASRWIRILFRVWKTRTPYDPARYLESLKAKNHPLLAYLEA